MSGFDAIASSASSMYGTGNVIALTDETTVLNFSRLLEQHQLTPQMMNVVIEMQTHQGLLLKGGTMVDASSIHAPPPTKNQAKARDLEMQQTSMIFALRPAKNRFYAA